MDVVDSVGNVVNAGPALLYELADRGVGVRPARQIAVAPQAVADRERSTLEFERDRLVDVLDAHAYARLQALEVAPPVLARLHVGLDQAAQHLGERARLLAVGILDQRLSLRQGSRPGSGSCTRSSPATPGCSGRWSAGRP